MIERKDGKVCVDGTLLSPGDVNLLRQMLKRDSPMTVFQLMEAVGSTYTQYISNRIRIMKDMFRLVIPGAKRGTYEIVPEIRDELARALEVI